MTDNNYDHAWFPCSSVGIRQSPLADMDSHAGAWEREIVAKYDLPQLIENLLFRLKILQERIAKRLGQARETIRNHLAKMPELANPANSDLSRGFTVPQVAEKHACPIFDPKHPCQK